VRLIVTTARQREVLECLAKGMSNVEAGKELGWCGSVIQVEVERLIKAYGVHDRPSLVRKAKALGALPVQVSDFAPVLRSMMERRAA
jgi:DNA-binding NarL/FixJ family response regulator